MQSSPARNATHGRHLDATEASKGPASRSDSSGQAWHALLDSSSSAQQSSSAAVQASVGSPPSRVPTHSKQQVDGASTDGRPHPTAAWDLLPAHSPNAQQPPTEVKATVLDPLQSLESQAPPEAKATFVNPPQSVESQALESPTVSWIPCPAAMDAGAARGHSPKGSTDRPCAVPSAQEQPVDISHTDAMEWVNSLLGALQSFPAATKHLLISLVMKPAPDQSAQACDAQAAASSAAGHGTSWLSQLRPTQSFQVVDGHEVAAADLQPARLIQCLPHVIR